MSASQPAVFNLQEFSDMGKLLVGGRLYTYNQGTTGFKAAFTDPAGVVPHTYTADGLGGQYIALNARGELPASLYLAAGSYDLALKRQDGSTVWLRQASGVSDSAIGVLAQVTAFLSSIASGAGSVLVGFIQAGTGMFARTSQEKMREWVSILDTGGSPNGTTINTSALAKLYDNGYRLIRFPAGGANNYLIDSTISSIVTANMLWDVDPGVTITVPDTGYLSPSLKVTRPTRIAIAGLNREYMLTPERGYVESFRPALLASSDVDYSVATPLYPGAGGFNYKKAAWPGGDDFTVYSPTSYGNDNVVISAPVDGNFYHALYVPKIGDELTAQLYNAVDNQILRAMVRTSTGYVGINFDTLTDSNPKYFEKYKGRAVAEVPINYPGVNTHVSYAAYYSLITIRINSKNNFSILFNGMEVLPARTVEGEIIEAGFGIYGVGPTAKITVQDPVVVRGGPQGGIAPVRIAAFGDSRTAAGMPDVWINWLRACLDGYKGMRIHNLINYAVSGAGIEEQAALCTPANIANVDIVVIDIGTNNIQSLTSGAAYYNTLKAMVQTCQANGKKVIIGVPDMFYGQGQAGAGVGQATQRYELGKDIRSKCLRLAADLGVKVVNKMEALGPITAQYVNASIANSYVSLGLDPVMYDSIHPTAFGHQLIARCYAAAIAGLLTTRPTGSTESIALPADGLRNGWTFGGASEAPTWKRSDDGEVRLQGLFLAGTVANGTVIYVLPEEVRPRKTQRLMGMNNSNTTMILNVDINGEISTPNVGTLSSYIGIDDIRFPSRLS